VPSVTPNMGRLLNRYASIFQATKLMPSLCRFWKLANRLRDAHHGLVRDVISSRRFYIPVIRGLQNLCARTRDHAPVASAHTRSQVRPGLTTAVMRTTIESKAVFLFQTRRVSTPTQKRPARLLAAGRPSSVIKA
jgi:hypothetical protein